MIGLDISITGSTGGGSNSTFINPAIKYASPVMPDLIRHPGFVWIPAFAGMTKH